VGLLIGSHGFMCQCFLMLGVLYANVAATGSKGNSKSGSDWLDLKSANVAMSVVTFFFFALYGVETVLLWRNRSAVYEVHH